jgi:hypothetical protein
MRESFKDKEHDKRSAEPGENKEEVTLLRQAPQNSTAESLGKSQNLIFNESRVVA